ncbi:MAG: hypothetical protein GX413_01530 [Acetobacter sp.]|jgi:hypothetical protein|nr:hypothetical protein [Acetobacter sp.]
MGRITGPARAKALDMVCLKYCAFLLLLNGVAIPVTERVAYAAPSAISRMSPATSARPVEDNEKAPPPPDGYEVLPDDDEIEITRWSPNMPPSRHASSVLVDASQTPRDDRNLPTIDVLGIPVTINAPVVPPYNGAFTYTTYAGQAGNGRNAPGAWGSVGEP